MTREKAADILEEILRLNLRLGQKDHPAIEAMKVALTALRGPTREMVEKVWRGEWHSHHKSGIHAGNGVVCSECDMWNNRAAHFCPSCGAPMTNESVEMVLRRWREAVQNG